ncbi:RNA polymerase sigma factor [Natronosporangium hydrolyticum]|uniref:RNA polymerase sigma factor n=1 Tax=Natronosporangium hydrolyticum TaxID=2811111 RepID=UPI001EFA1E27|nr:sigma-70 family RNA polymerase sigma factor [Natronosporangium hydrolyticum]
MSSPDLDEQVERAVDAIWRIESGRVVAAVARTVGGDVGLAEDLAQDALVAALAQWRETGVPENPGAWLTTVAKRRAIDHFRRRQRERERVEQLGQELLTAAGDDPELTRLGEPDFGDDLLRLIFVSCHPVLSPDARAALTLRLLGGLRTSEIAHGFLVPEPTIAQRIVRAKQTLARAAVPFEVPDQTELPERLASVLEVVYLIFNEGYSASSGDEWLRPELTDEALRLGRRLAALLPAEPEVHGLVALMELQASRNRARVAPDGSPVRLLEQDRARWDRLLIRRGLAALRRAEAAAGRAGPYQLQAAIAACHARALTPEQTDWARIAALYGELGALTGSPVVALNRAVAVAQAQGPAAGLALVDELVDEPALRGYHLLPAVRGELLSQLGREQAARAEFARAAELTDNARERQLLRERAAGP